MDPGSLVTLTGLRGNPKLNGQTGTVQPRDTWRDGRIAVELSNTEPLQCIAVKPENLQIVRTCFICLEAASSDAPLLQPGCGCRGTSGHVHAHCAIAAAAARHERQGTWAGVHPWQKCPTCKLPYTGPLKLALAQEWSRRTEALPPVDTQRFAARTTLGNALSALGKLADAEDVVRANLQTAIAVHGAEHRMSLGTTLNLGLLLDGQGKYAEASAVYDELHTTQARVLGPDHRDTLATAMQRAGAMLNRGQYAEAEAQYRQVQATLTSTVGPTDPSTLTCQMNLASALLSQAKYKEACTLFGLNLAAKQRKLGPEHVDTLMAGMNYGAALKERGQYAQAEAAFTQNLTTKARVLGEEHADTCFAALNLVLVWVDTALLGGAEDEEAAEEEDKAEDARTVCGKCGGAEEGAAPQAAAPQAAVQHAAADLSPQLDRSMKISSPSPPPPRLDEARGLVTRTQAALTRAFGPSHPSVLSASMHHGAVLHARGQHDEAAPLLRGALAAQTAALGDTHPEVLETAWRLGALLIAMRDAAGAEGLLQGVVAQLTERMGAQHPRTLRARVSLSEARLLAAAAADEAEGGCEQAAAAAVATIRGELRDCEQRQRAVLDDDHPELAKTSKLLSRMMREAGAGKERKEVDASEKRVQGDEEVSVT